MLLLLFIAALPLSALAAEQHQYPNVTDVVQILFTDADENGDGKLTLREFIENFIKFDLNEDDRISRTEFANYTIALAPELEGLEEALFKLLDSDHDHRLEMNDFVKFYKAIDTDGDDYVSEEQYKAYFITVYHNLSKVPDIIG